MKSRGVVAVLVSIALAVSLGACVGTPGPAESTPAFASEQEAFEAAEATYRAYVDALNQVDLADPETFEPVYALTTGELNATDRKNFSQWHADGYRITGEAVVTTVIAQPDAISSYGEVVIDACYDVSAIDVVDSDGASLVSDSRPDRQSLEVHLLTGRDKKSTLVIGRIAPSTAGTTC